MAVAKSIEAGFDSCQAGSSHNEASSDGVSTDGHDEPPTYVATSSRAMTGSLSQPITNIPPFSFTAYSLPMSTWSDDRTTCTTTASHLANSPSALFELIRKQLTLPPKPVVRITGTHADWCYSWGNTKIDFDITLDIMPLILPPKTTTDGHVCIRCLSDSDADLRAEVNRFCEDDAERKCFTIERQVTGWDTDFLEREIQAVLITTKYKGDVRINFPVTNSKVVVLKESPVLSIPEIDSKVSGKYPWRPRSKIGKAKQLYLATTKARAFDTILVKWPYSIEATGSDALERGSKFGGTSKQCLVQSEQVWWDMWKEPIRSGVLHKKQGWVTIEDWKDIAMGHVRVPEEVDKTWANSADDWHTVRKSFKWADKEAARQYLHEKGLTRAESRSTKKWHLAGVGGI